MNKELMFSSATDKWATPQDFYDKLNKEFHFTLDPCADETNHKCGTYFTEDQDGLKQDWGGHVVFCNPPYGTVIKNWVEKCYRESLKPNTTVVMLIPSRTDTKYQHEYIFRYAKLILFIKGRLRFGGHNNSAPFPSQLVLYTNDITPSQENALKKFGYLTKGGV